MPNMPSDAAVSAPHWKTADSSMEELQQQTRCFPTSPGVYLMRDAAGTILYVGKGRNLRQRVRSYFGNSDSRPQVRFLMARVASIDFTITDTEKEALLLENTLIKQHKPRYNLNLKDDKTYFSLRIDLSSPFPRFTIVRRVKRDGASYFGPYTSSVAAKEVLRQLQRIFPLRHYPLKTCLSRPRPCLYHQIKRCSAPCHKLISSEDYRKLVDAALLFLKGKSRELVSGFKQQMLQASQQQRYEEAARLRDLLKAVETTLEHQKMVSGGGDFDLLGLAGDGSSVAVAVLFVRNGILTGSSVLHGDGGIDDCSALGNFIQLFYAEGREIPDSLLLSEELEGRETLEGWLSGLKGKKVKLRVPQRGDKYELLQMAERNAEAALSEQRDRTENLQQTLKELKERLSLPQIPERIECYDISTIQGHYSVGSGITFINGEPARERYRRYRIRQTAGQNDFAMLQELFERRFSRNRIEDWGLPDLVLVDGGIGQLNSTLEVLRQLGLEEKVSLAGIAKSRVRRDQKKREPVRTEERIFLPGRRNPVRFRQDGAAIRLLAAIRDEAHRFAIEYHRKLRRSGTIRSALHDIPGVGSKVAKRLLVRFGSLQGIKNATAEQLSTVAGVGIELAGKIICQLIDRESAIPLD